MFKKESFKIYCVSKTFLLRIFSIFHLLYPTQRKRNQSFIKYFLLFLTIGIIKVTFAEYNPNLPVNTELDRLIIRMTSIYGQPLPVEFYFQPYKFEVLRVYLDSISSEKIKTSEYELELFKKAQKRYGPYSFLYAKNDTKNDLNLSINLNLLGDIQSGIKDSVFLRIAGIAQPALSGNLGKFSFYSGIDVRTEYRSDTLFPQSSYQPYDGISYTLYNRKKIDNIRALDIVKGGISYDMGRIKVETALDYLKIGPALYYPLTLSGNAPPIVYFRGNLNLDIIHYQHLFGNLKVEKDKKKYIFVHRLDADFLKKKIHLGINEVIIYGNTTSREPLSDTDKVAPQYIQNDRTIEWPYLIPFLPFPFVEHYIGDRDNSALSFDLTIFLPEGWRWYGEFFLDDMLNPWKIFSDDFGNKWGVTLGVNYFGNVFKKEFTFIAEYSRVEPWVYTHFCGGSHRYTHFNVCLGSPLGPNSQGAVVKALLQVTKLHEIGIGIIHTAYNRKVRGGEITDIFQVENPENPEQYHDNMKKRFLGPGTEWSLQPTLYWNFNLFGIFELASLLGVEMLEKKGDFKFWIGGGLYF